VHVAVNQWLQFDIGPPTLVTGLITKGRGDTGKKHWVTRYRLSYSNDSQIWYYYKDASHLDPKVCKPFLKPRWLCDNSKCAEAIESNLVCAALSTR